MSNETMRATWDADAAGWIETEADLDAVLAPVTTAVVQAADLASARRVLDVGCGTGALLEAAARRGAHEVVGVDIAEPMVAAAQARVPSATVLAADAQTADLGLLGAPFDRIVSRFGVMFFADPVAAFANLRSAAAPGARLAFACWREVEENPMFTLGTSVLTRRWDAELGDRPRSVPGAPGPVSMAEYARVRAVLVDAGWRDVAVRPLDYVHDHGYAGGDGVESRLAVILATATGRAARARLLPLLGEDGWAALLDEVRTELRRHRVDGVVRYPGACWLVTASNPA
ncbi:class I SAM-dependent methyltransferase [Nocardioides zeae]|uniref:Class I SAM-dependent methyltransferase n=1 Tax=Nocardioides imazamoxiresistens TaxID=3231893 RepID=A0ABU3PWK3_9ACTN|nr:class I SAM-dependent methyltransferase [Nocardioides zeae]MDT9593612.1 class I SAM-dependent methyltransferase [Nocardioides zeae]